MISHPPFLLRGSTADSTGPTSMIINIYAGPYGFTGVHPCETGPAPLCPSHPLRKSTGSATLSGFRFHPSSFSPPFDLFRVISSQFDLISQRCRLHPRPVHFGKLRKPTVTCGSFLKPEPHHSHTLKLYQVKFGHIRVPRRNLRAISSLRENHVPPAVRKMGWYGIVWTLQKLSKPRP
jgi:hypothetical protein